MKMSTILKLTILAALFIVGGCTNKYRVLQSEPTPELSENEGYLSFVIDTLDPLRSIQMLNVDTQEEFYVGNAPKGLSQVTIKIPEGEYCLIGFDVYDWRIDYKDRGFCTYIEAEELNYFSQFRVRNPITNARQNFTQFVQLLKKDQPQLCKKYINKGC